MNDNWGSSARIGIFVVGSEVVPEAEWWAMAPAGVSIHAARVTAGAPWATWTADRRGIALAHDVERGAAQFAAMRCAAVVIAHTSSSILGGEGWDAAVIKTLSELSGAAAQTNGSDCIAALRAVGARRPLLVLPPWFDAAFAQRAATYLGANGFDCADSLLHVPAPTPGAAAPRIAQIEQRLDTLQDQIIRACPGDADAIFIAGTGFRCVGIIDALEAALGRPVVTANQASLWHALHKLRIKHPRSGYGRLFTDHVTRRRPTCPPP